MTAQQQQQQQQQPELQIAWFRAIQNGTVDEVRRLLWLRDILDINATDRSTYERYTALHYAVLAHGTNYQNDMIYCLLHEGRDGINVNARDYQGRTPLYVYLAPQEEENNTRQVDVRIVQALLEAGADPNVTDKPAWYKPASGKALLTTALTGIRINNNNTMTTTSPQVIQMLFRYGVNPHLINHEYWGTPLHQLTSFYCRVDFDMWRRYLQVVLQGIRNWTVVDCQAPDGVSCLTATCRGQTALDCLQSYHDYHFVLGHQQEWDKTHVCRRVVLKTYAHCVVQCHQERSLHQLLAWLAMIPPQQQRQVPWYHPQDHGAWTMQQEAYLLPVGRLTECELQVLLLFVIAAKPTSMYTTALNDHGQKWRPCRIARAMGLPPLIVQALQRPWMVACDLDLRLGMVYTLLKASLR